ncbi:2OG-Fe dioxygenase family protein [Stenotrophomonas sp. NPDC101269]|uniref:2OG-Fe dioxygenase family protein n=2 Tax=Lysobacteraceae TaxID=32033 RepID=UPI0013136EEA|nr:MULTISPECIES: 2OG-Fe dioxygenase family protein [Stenotrophomonas]
MHAVPLPAPPPLRAAHCLAAPLPAAPGPQLFTLDTLGLPASFLDDVASHADSLCWDPYDVQVRRRRVLQRYRCILAAPQRDLLDACDGDAGHPAWPVLLDGLPGILADALRRVAPHRRRAMRTYLADRRVDGSWWLQPLPDTVFEQPGNADRIARRQFAPLSPVLSNHPGLLRLLACVAETVHARRAATRLRLVVHQMLTVAGLAGGTEPAPEGIHQDGADFIVSALVVRRRGIHGGVSRVRRGPTGPVHLERALAEGEGIFQPDTRSPWWHEVSTIHADAAAFEGYRMILGVDAHLLPDATA